MIVHRIDKARRAGSAFTGEGARIAGGRWNPVGVPMVYCSASLALAALEVFVHLSYEGWHISFVSFRIDIPDRVKVDAAAPLPRNWREEPPGMPTQEVGYKWMRGGASAALMVPSAIVPSEFNVLLNPAHRDFQSITMGKPEPFSFDPRMWKADAR